MSKRHLFRDEYENEFEIHRVVSKNKTLLKPIVLVDKYANAT